MGYLVRKKSPNGDRGLLQRSVTSSYSAVSQKRAPCVLVCGVRAPSRRSAGLSVGNLPIKQNDASIRRSANEGFTRKVRSLGQCRFQTLPTKLISC